MEFSLNNEDDNSVNELQGFYREFLKLLDSYKLGITVDIIYSEIAQYYTRKAYPKINEIENKMRKLIYLFMLKNFGNSWLKDGTPVDINQKII